MKKLFILAFAALAFAASAQTAETLKAADTAGGLLEQFGTNAAYDGFMAKQKELDAKREAEYLAAADAAAGLVPEFGTNAAYDKAMVTKAPTPQGPSGPLRCAGEGREAQR